MADFGLSDTYIGNDPKFGNIKVVDGSVGSKSPATLDVAANSVGAGMDPTDAGIHICDRLNLAGKNRINFPFMGG